MRKNNLREIERKPERETNGEKEEEKVCVGERERDRERTHRRLWNESRHVSEKVDMSLFQLPYLHVKSLS